MFLHVPEAMCLLLCPKLHVPLCSQGCVFFRMFKATYHVSAHVSEPEHVLCTWDNESICVWRMYLELPVVLQAKLRGKRGSSSF